MNLKTNFSVVGRIREDTVRRCLASLQGQLLLLNTLPEDGVHLSGFASSIHLTGRASEHTVNKLFFIQEAHFGRPLVHCSQGKHRDFLGLLSGLSNSQPCQFICLEEEPLELSHGPAGCLGSTCVFSTGHWTPDSTSAVCMEPSFSDSTKKEHGNVESKPLHKYPWTICHMQYKAGG